MAGLVAFALVAGALVANAVGDRRDGDGITGEVTQTPTQAASECIDLTVSQQLVDAIPCYQDVLAEDPDNAVAHTYLGWTLFLTARQAGEALPQDVLVDLYVRARDQLDQAVEADPGYADARAFQIVLATREGRFEEAQAQLDAFDDLDAPADIQRLVDGLRQEITDGLAGAGDVPEGSDPTASEPASSPTTAGAADGPATSSTEGPDPDPTGSTVRPAEAGPARPTGRDEGPLPLGGRRLLGGWSSVRGALGRGRRASPAPSRTWSR